MQNIIEILKQFFIDEKLFPKSKMADLDQNVSLLETGVIDSINLLNLVLFVEERFQIKVLDEDLTPENFETLSAIQALIGRKIG